MDFMSREPVSTASPAPGATPAASLLEDQILGVEAALHELRRDPEGMVHDARIALRKLRSSLSLYAPMLHAEPAKALRRELTWLSGQLGPARDSQVLLSRMRTSVAEESREDEEGDEILLRFADDEREAFAGAQAALESERFTALIARLDVARLRSLVVPGAAQEDLAGQDLQRLLHDLTATRGASDARLHDLRKAVKKARYVRGRHDGVDAALKRVQAVLGEHQDSVVARERLAAIPVSRLQVALVAHEAAAGARSEKELRKAVRKLQKAIDKGAIDKGTDPSARRDTLRSGA